MVLPSRGPEEMAEERCAKDERGKDTGEDVVARCANVVVVANVRSAVEAVDALLLVDVV